eukprot:1810206-Amphidinium_carterae.1
MPRSSVDHDELRVGATSMYNEETASEALAVCLGDEDLGVRVAAAEALKSWGDSSACFCTIVRHSLAEDTIAHELRWASSSMSELERAAMHSKQSAEALRMEGVECALQRRLHQHNCVTFSGQEAQESSHDNESTAKQASRLAMAASSRSHLGNYCKCGAI